MDNELEYRVREAVEQLRSASIEEMDAGKMDPVAKMMLVALLHEGQRITDYIESLPQRIVERFCTDFIPHRNVEAMPAVTLLRPTFKPKAETDTITVEKGISFAYKPPECRQTITYIPMFRTMLLPCKKMFLLTPHSLTCDEEIIVSTSGPTNQVWVGLVTEAEVDTLRGLSLLITGTGGISPEHIVVARGGRGGTAVPLDFCTMNEMEHLDMLEPFDSQQAPGRLLTLVEQWKESLLNMDDATLVYCTQAAPDRDLFKPHAYPTDFGQRFEDDVLDHFSSPAIWLRLDFADGYSVPKTFGITINVMPATNIEVNTLTLTPSSPIAKLQKRDDSFFLDIVETSLQSQKQGFDRVADNIIVRDFDANTYHNGDLYRDVRNLYNHFIDDYYAFKEYNGIKDGKLLADLRETVNTLADSDKGGVGCENDKFKFDSGTYVMFNIGHEAAATPIRVSYITTLGEVGNMPKRGDFMSAGSKLTGILAGIEKKVTVIADATGGTDKATADARYELLRYYSLTGDRLYTRMDIDAFLRKELMLEFGKEEFSRIFTRVSIQGAGGDRSLRRGLYIDIEFKDRKNYERAVQKGYDRLMQQKVANRSCIAMPIIVALKNLEG